MRDLMPPRARARRNCFKHWIVCGAWLFYCAIFPAAARAQAPDAFAPLGQITGDQVSVVGPSRAVVSGAAHAIEFRSGDAIVVFAGKARIEFTGGGEVDICGPAKFTVLASGQALTIALNFGRVHVRFDALRPITVYTAMVVATPVSLGDRSRDATVGLTNTGTMCVLAAQGAVRLQNQLSGETVIVPEPSEVFVPGASFTSLPAAAGQCRCDFDEPASQSTPTPLPLSALPPPSGVLNEQTVPIPLAAKPSSAQNLPTAAPQSAAESSTASAQPIFKATLPPIGYDAKSATETAEPLSVATLILAQNTVVHPAWIFHGTVVDSAKKHGAPSSAQTSANASARPKRGFWAKLHHFFTGS
jgi:hypothetical protein